MEKNLGTVSVPRFPTLVSAVVTMSESLRHPKSNMFRDLETLCPFMSHYDIDPDDVEVELMTAKHFLLPSLSSSSPLSPPPPPFSFLLLSG